MSSSERNKYFGVSATESFMRKFDELLDLIDYNRTGVIGSLSSVFSLSLRTFPKFISENERSLSDVRV